MPVMDLVLYLLAVGSIASLWLTAVQGKEPDQVPKITSNATTADVIDDDIAHFTCSARGQPTPSISWLRSGKDLTSSDKGVKILSTNASSRLVNSHLFVAVTASDRRGDYLCVASNKLGKTERMFVIKGSSNGGGMSVNQIAIALSASLCALIFGSIAFFLIRAQWRLRTNGEETANANALPQNGVTPSENHVQAIAPYEDSPPTEETPMIQTSCL